MALSGSLTDGELESGNLSSLEGDIEDVVTAERGHATDKAGAYDTLDEPILTSVIRDLRAVGQKLFFALLPSKNNVLMREWDLWGPLFLCIYIGLLLQGMSTDSDSSRFTAIFMVYWTGVAVVTYNTVFVQKATVSMFQCLSVIGYCLAPVALIVSLFEVFHIFGVATNQVVLRLLLVTGGVTWASFSSVKILRAYTEEEKKLLVLGPIVLLYATLGLLIAFYTYSEA